MLKNLAAKYYQENKKDYKEKLVKYHKARKIFLKKKKKKINNIVVNITKIFQKMKSKSLFSIKKKYDRMRKNALL